MSVAIEDRWPGECGECIDLDEFAWDFLHPPVNDGPVATCRTHRMLAPGWVYVEDDLRFGHDDEFDVIDLRTTTDSAEGDGRGAGVLPLKQPDDRSER